MLTGSPMYVDPLLIEPRKFFILFYFIFFHVFFVFFSLDVYLVDYLVHLFYVH